MISISEELYRLAQANEETAAAKKPAKKAAKKKPSAAKKAKKPSKTAAKKVLTEASHASEMRRGAGLGRRLIALLNKRVSRPTKLAKDGSEVVIDLFKNLEDEAKESKAGKATKSGAQSFWLGVATAMHGKDHGIKPKTPVTALKEKVKARIEGHKFTPLYGRPGKPPKRATKKSIEKHDYPATVWPETGPNTKAKVIGRGFEDEHTNTHPESMVDQFTSVLHDADNENMTAAQWKEMAESYRSEHRPNDADSDAEVPATKEGARAFIVRRFTRQANELHNLRLTAKDPRFTPEGAAKAVKDYMAVPASERLAKIEAQLDAWKEAKPEAAPAAPKKPVLTAEQRERRKAKIKQLQADGKIPAVTTTREDTEKAIKQAAKKT